MNHRYFMPVIFVITTAGCVQFQSVDGNGRFLQASINNQVVVQMDLSTPESCKAEGYVIKKNPNFVITCATSSLAETLPYAFSMTNNVTTERIIIRTKTLKACEFFCEFVREEVEKKSKNNLYEFGACK